jgi:hypothetical protein
MRYVARFVFLIVVLAVLPMTRQLEGRTQPQAGNEPAPPAPDSKALFEKKCSACHGLDEIYATKRTASEWNAVITEMREYGADMTDEEHKLILDYLSKNVGR